MSHENDNQPLPEEAPAPDEDSQREIAALRVEMEALRDRSLRALAEVENVRKRLERERDEARTYSVARFARDILTVADNLTRALAACPAEARARAEDSLKAVLDGVEATERELNAALGRYGVKAIEAEGRRFDPNLHQAIAEVPAANAQAGTVVSVVQPGYTIGDRLLRPAMVTVAKAATPQSAGAQGAGANGAGGQVDTKV
jgi:molecular chaperone GrpE